ncbi:MULTISPECIES: hypothetical protein [unclassified Geodermatophilus]|uniref:hypothetical protein n=1 Tax=unclassified Geodermatophilus TaxID=2637632 RepID=UPI003F535B76
MWINDYHPYVPGAEWGGRGQSGWAGSWGPRGWRSTASSSTCGVVARPAPVAGSPDGPRSPALGEPGRRSAPYLSRLRAITIRWIWLVPS